MVAKLIAEEGTLEGLVLWLDVGDEWIVGRDPDEADLVVEDPKVSRRHARCRRTDEGILIENISNTNLLLANGVEILEPYALAEGDKIQMGDTLFHFTTSNEGEEAIPTPEAVEEEPYDEIFDAPPPPTGTSKKALTVAGRWLVKVVAGPNTGAELSLEPKHSYTLGTDPDSCDIVFHDLSVSRQHARIDVSEAEELTIEDLHSRNGVVVDGREISERSPLSPNSVVSLGTTTLVLIDREAAQETIISAAPPEEEVAMGEEEEEEFPQPEEVVEKRRPVLAGGTFLLLLIGLAIAVVAVTGGFSLFKTKQIHIPKIDHTAGINSALSEFPDVRFTFNPSGGTLFLLGHVLTPIDKSELLYNLQELNYIKNIDDNIVVDQYIWEETNTILAKNANWVGVSMHAPIPGQFVLTGYLKTRQQASTLGDYMRLNFPYVDRLDNQVVVEELLMDEISADLLQAGFSGVQPSLENGSLALKGFVQRSEARRWDQLLEQFTKMRGIRQVRNFVVLLSEEEAVVDLSGRYQVQGFSSRDGNIISILINGQIIGVGDTFQGMRVTRLTPTTLYLQKDGVKYKIDYKR